MIILTDKITVIHSDGKTEVFKPRLIGQAIMKETGVDEDLAIKIQKELLISFINLKKMVWMKYQHHKLEPKFLLSC